MNLGLVSKIDVSGDVWGYVRTEPVCEIEQHICFAVVAHNSYNAVKMIALGLPLNAAVHQDLIRPGRGLNFFHEAVVLMERHGQYQIHALRLIPRRQQRNSQK